MRQAPFLALLAFLTVAARADDGALTYGGAPRLLSKHPSIRMVSESVTIDVLKQGYRVEATFVFRNEGSACQVRMGFPDRGDGADGTVFGEETEDAAGKGRPRPVYEGLEGFASSVDGKKAITKLVPDGQGSQSWHTKTVAFGRNQTRTVRVRYLADGGGATASGAGYLRELGYVLHTGASWKGPIGYAAVLVRFAPGTLKGPMLRFDARKLGRLSPFDLTDLRRRPKGTVFWKGPARPRKTANSLLFVRRDFEPRERDDIDLWFGFPHRYSWQDADER